MNTQSPIDLAREAGTQAATACLAKAQRAAPDFADLAKAAILAHLAAHGPTSGENLVDVALIHGARCKDARAFGGVFQSLARKGLIKCLRSDLPRIRGHGTTGGKLWSIGSLI